MTAPALAIILATALAVAASIPLIRDAGAMRTCSGIMMMED